MIVVSGSQFDLIQKANKPLFEKMCEVKSVRNGKREIVINECFGGFSLSEAAYEELGLKWDGFGYIFNDDEYRDCQALVSVVKKLKEKSWGGCAELKIVEVPDDMKWTIEEYDGKEWASEAHKAWR